MAKLIHAAIASLDGYVEDERGNFEWSAPDEEVHAFVNEMERPIGTYLYGRRMYETMVFWETAGAEPDEPAVLAGNAIRAGLVDECHLFLCPIVVGGGKRALPADVRIPLALVDEHRFANGVVHLHYRVIA